MSASGCVVLAGARAGASAGTTEDNEWETQARTLTAQAASAQRQADKLSEAHLRALAERDAARRERDHSRALLAQLGYAPPVLCSRIWSWLWVGALFGAGPGVLALCGKERRASRREADVCNRNGCGD